MNMKLSVLLLMAVVVTLPKKARSQEDADRKVSIEITTTENGNTTTKKIDLDNATEAEIEAAMKELGVMDHFVVNGEDGNVVIDIRKFGTEGGEEKSMRMRMAPIPPMPPIPPNAALIEKTTWLGVNTESLNEELIAEKKLSVKEGVHVLEVIDGSPASAAGLQKGDIITAVDGEAIKDPKALSDAIRAKEPGEKVRITYYRDAKKDNLTAELAERENKAYAYGFGDGEHWKDHMGRMHEPRAFLGVTPGDGDADGALIGSVEEGSAAEKMGIQEGDVIRTVNGEAIGNFNELSELIASMRPGDDVTIKIDRKGSEQELTGALGERKMDLHFSMPEGEHFNFDFEGFSEEDREELREDMDQLREEMDKLREELGHDLRSETRITIESRKLTDEEKALLEEKGVKGLDNELKLDDLSTFPNPSNGFFRIHFDVPENGDLNVDVHDASGEKVYEEKITGFKGKYERTLDLSDKASGNYFLVITQNGKATSRKLVKQ